MEITVHGWCKSVEQHAIAAIRRIGGPLGVRERSGPLGQTPDEMYFATGADVPEKLQAARLLAKQVRREDNLARSCPSCRDELQLVAIEPIPYTSLTTASTVIPSDTSPGRLLRG